MKRNCLAKSVFHHPKTTRRNFGTLNLRIKQRLPYGKKRGKFTGKELDPETGLYYFGARYLDPKTARWMSGDPALVAYIPLAPVNDRAKRYNQNLPGLGGIFNVVNMHVYHYAGNNPVKYTDPDGKFFGIDDAIGAACQCWNDGDWNKFGERFKSNFTNSWKLLGNMFNTFHDIHNVGDFFKSMGEFIARFTLGLPSTIAGFVWGWIQIEGGGKYNSYKNLSVITFDDRRGSAYTVGYVVIGPDDIMTDPVWLAHENGHYYFSLFTNMFYLIHGLDSLINAPNAPDYYMYRTEVLADKLGGVRRDQNGNRYVP